MVEILFALVMGAVIVNIAMTLRLFSAVRPADSVEQERLERSVEEAMRQEAHKPSPGSMEEGVENIMTYSVGGYTGMEQGDNL